MAFFVNAVRLFTPWAGKKLLINSRLSAVRVQTVNQVRSFHQASSFFQRCKIPLQERRYSALERRNRFLLIESLRLALHTFGCTIVIYYFHKWSDDGTLKNRTTVWPQSVKDRIESTYAHFTASILISTMSFYRLSQATKLLILMKRSPYLTFGATFAALIGSGMFVRSMPYSEGINGKHLAWILHNCTIGTAVACLCSLGGPRSLKAAMYIAGAMAGFSSAGVWASTEDRLLHMSDFSFAFAIGHVFISTVATKKFLLSLSTILASRLFDITNYGLLAIICAYFLNDSKKVIDTANNLDRPYDPINESISIYIDSLKDLFRMLHIF